MNIRFRDGAITLWNFDSARFAIVKSWGLMKWDRKTQSMQGKATMELLDKLSTIGTLPPSIEAERTRLHAVAEAVDAERMNSDPTPFYPYPVTATLYAHQRRAANMALLTFGFVGPEAANSKTKETRGDENKCHTA